ncbi:MAG: hypothetical protein ACR2NZ_21200 [Rubripirellula sp.]
MNHRSTSFLTSFCVCGLLWLIAIASVAYSAPPRFSVEQDSIQLTAELIATTPQVADPVQYRIVVDAPVGASVVMPRVAENLGDFAVIKSQATRDAPLEGAPDRRRTELRLTLESLQPGLRATPNVEVLYQLPDKNDDNGQVASALSTQGALQVPSLSIEIESVLTEAEAPDKFRDIKAAIETPQQSQSSNDRTAFIASGAIGILALLGAGWWWRKRAPKPAVWAMKQITRIEEEHKQGTLPTPDAYTEVSLGLRRYLQLAHDTPARALSTDEITHTLEQHGFSAVSIASARRVLETADACKFSPEGAVNVDRFETPFEDARSVIAESQAIHSRRPGVAAAIDEDRPTANPRVRA